MADASRGWKFTRKSALRTWHAHVTLRTWHAHVVNRAAQTALALRWERLHIVATASVAEQSASGKRRERLNIVVTASRAARHSRGKDANRRPRRAPKSRTSWIAHDQGTRTRNYSTADLTVYASMTSPALERMLRPGNDVHRASCACRAWTCIIKRTGTTSIAQVAHAEGETALPNARERVGFAQVALRRV